MTGTAVPAQQGPASRAQHLIGDVQRFGLLSAATVVDRYIGLVAGAITDSSPPSAEPTQADTDTGWLVIGAARMVEASLRLLDVTATLIGNSPGQNGAAQATDVLVLPSTRSGSSTEQSLWIHNPTESPAAGLGLNATSLVSSNGSCVPVDAVSFAPENVDLLAPGSSLEVRLRVDVPAGQPPGDYHGLVLSSAVPSEPIALRLHVQAPAEYLP